MRFFTTRISESGSLLLDRQSALSDGVIAIVLTLLVLGIQVPDHHSFSEEGLLSFLGKVEYELTVYAVSFVLIGTYWIQHNAMFHYIQHGTRTLTWLNLFFLFALTLIPFVTELIGTYKNEPLVIVVYGVVHVMCGAMLAVIWWYATGKGRLVRPDIHPTVVRSMMHRILAGPAVSLVAIGTAFVNVRLAHVVFLTMPLFYVSHRTVDTYWDSSAPSTSPAGEGTNESN